MFKASVPVLRIIIVIGKISAKHSHGLYQVKWRQSYTEGFHLHFLLHCS